MPHATWGNVLESRGEVGREIERLIGLRASQNNLERQVRLINLLGVIDKVRANEFRMSSDRYLEVVEKIQHIKEEIK